MLSFIEPLRVAFSITPRLLFPPHFYLWTVGTFCLIEASVFLLFYDLVCVHLASKLIEPLWGPVEIAKYFAIVNISVAFGTTSVLLVAYAILIQFAEDPESVFELKFSGFTGFNSALFVAVKQILPDDVIFKTPVGKVKNTHLPALIILIFSILTVVRLASPVYLIMCLTGVFSGWIYLRFFQPHANGMKGDMAEHFSFARY